MYKLKNDVTIVIDWFERNLMKANPDKFTVMFLTPTRAVDDLPEYLLVNDVSMGPLKGGSGAMCYVQKSLACYVLCKFLFALLCEIKIGCYAEVQPVLCAM